MNQPSVNSVPAFFREDRLTRFWVLQLAGWTCLSIVSYFSLNLWYDQPDAAYIGHNVVQSLLGIALSWPLRYVYRRVWDDSLIVRIVYISIAVLIFSGLWSLFRLAFFQWMTGTSGLWADFGGWLFPSIFIFMCWTALYHGFKYYRLVGQEHSALLQMESAKNLEASRAARAETLARDAQLAMLRYQLNPHFLFNTLNAVQSLVATRRNAHATGMISALSEFLRYSLYTNSGEFVSVEDEIAAIKLYLEIEKIRFGDRLVVTINVSQDVRSQQLPSMLLQPLVENAIKYGVARSAKGGTLHVDAYSDATHLCIDVVDSGAEMKAREAIGEPGVGLSNIRQRLEVCYSQDYDLTLHRLPEGGVRAGVRVPLQRIETVN
ncbi:histidine kinase [Congregibacter brevis]|uniref:Histidine kinase n=1 Tax=Congregibacter brevis TaxID=3081201 RepID=A0ABZ0IGP7_9GAMM|nr:histidine kinase [Congregibacter sp. IMCC45268]